MPDSRAIPLIIISLYLVALYGTFSLPLSRGIEVLFHQSRALVVR